MYEEGNGEEFFMGSIQNPVGGPTDPLGRPFRPPPIDPDAEAKENEERETPPVKEEWGIAAYILQMFKNALDLIIGGRKEGKDQQRAVKEHLRALKSAFEILKQEDRSQDLDFLNRLSKTWLSLLEDSLHFESEEASTAFKAFVKKIQHYPENQPHSFAYYLTENTHQQWIPFPYMELIQKLHSEHRKNPSSSPLAEWTALLDQTILLLHPA